MVAVTFGMLWFGYAVAFYGYTRVKGYNVTFADLVIPGRAITWPPPMLAEVPPSVGDPGAGGGGGGGSWGGSPGAIPPGSGGGGGGGSV